MVKCCGVISKVILPLFWDKKSISCLVVICKMWAFLPSLFAILTIFLVDEIAHSSSLHIGCEWTLPFSLNFFLKFKISSSSEWTATIFDVLSNTFSISSSLWTKRVPVEEPANNLTPQHPSNPLRLANSLWLVGAVSYTHLRAHET